MSRMKQYATEVSKSLGLGGDITDEVLRMGNMILERETVADAARRTGASRQRLHVAIKRGMLRCEPGIVRIGRTVRKADVDAYLSSSNRTEGTLP